MSVLKTLSWTAFKVLAIAKNASVQILKEDDNGYALAIFDGPMAVSSHVEKQDPRCVDQIDFEDNFKAQANARLAADLEIVNGKCKQLVDVKNIVSVATVPADAAVGATSVKVADANAARVVFEFYNLSNQTLRLKLQAKAADDDVKGIPVPAGASWSMPPDNIYDGEISVISESAVAKPFTYLEY